MSFTLRLLALAAPERARQELMLLGLSALEAEEESERLGAVNFKVEGLPPAWSLRLKSAADREGLLYFGNGRENSSALLLSGSYRGFNSLGSRLAAEAPGDLGRDLQAALKAVRRERWTLKLPNFSLQPNLELGPRTLIMGIVNVTPDSFSDGGRFFDAEAAVRVALQMEEAGADLIDIGGESSRPGAEPVSAAEEQRRVLPVISALAPRLKIPISIDTYKAKTARAALKAGAAMINDISGLRFDPGMVETAAETGAPVMLMHIQGAPRNMQADPHYESLMGEIIAYLRGSLEIARQAGVDPEQTVVDPGIGFGKRMAHNLAIISRLAELKILGRPILMGVSRKAFIGAFTGGLPAAERIYGTAAAVAASALNGAQIVRIHDLPAMKQAVMIVDAVRREGGEYQP